MNGTTVRRILKIEKNEVTRTTTIATETITEIITETTVIGVEIPSRVTITIIDRAVMKNSGI
jgi:hypothetical protein